MSIELSEGPNTSYWYPWSSALTNVSVAMQVFPAEQLGDTWVYLNITDLAGNGAANVGDFLAFTSSAFSASTTYVVSIIYNPTGNVICDISFTG